MGFACAIRDLFVERLGWAEQKTMSARGLARIIREDIASAQSFGRSGL
jgi:hypothetical protein